MKRTIAFRPERCLMCRCCVLACGIKALGRSGPLGLLPGQKPPRRLAVTLVDGTPHASRCRHCLQAPCEEACISGSIVRDEERSAVLHNAESCVGCGTCQLVCPFNAISRGNGSSGMAKCNLCPDEATPPCVGACRTGALTLEGVDRVAQQKRITFATEMIGERGNG